MRRILITGISGVGKSSVIAALAVRGYRAEDLDGPAYSHWVEVTDDDLPGGTVEPGRDWVWREERVAALLAEPGPAGAGPLGATDDLLFVSGTAPNMRRFLPQFDGVVLLSAPAAVIAARLATRTTNDYGKEPGEAARVLEHIASVEPLLRRVAQAEIDTRAPLEDVVDAVLRWASA